MIEWDTIQKYIEMIEECIRQDVRLNGRIQLASPGRERVGNRADSFAGILVSLSNTLAIELGIGGDPNITLLQCMSMISYAWMIFILQAKSNAPQRYSEEALKHMKEAVENYPLIFQKIHKESVKLGNEYHVDNPKWLAAVMEYEEKHRKTRNQNDSERKKL